MNKFVKSILVAALMATALSACTSREEAVSKVQSEGVIDFQDGWKLHLPNTGDPRGAQIVKKAGPTYIYSEDDKIIFSYSCGDNGNLLVTNTDLGLTMLQSDGHGNQAMRGGGPSVLLGIGLRAPLFNGLGKDMRVKEEAELINANNILKVDGPESAEYLLTKGLEYTQANDLLYMEHPAIVKMSSIGAVPKDFNPVIEQLAKGQMVPRVTTRPYKLPPIQNPGLYNGSVCNFTWDKFDPRDIESHDVKPARQNTKEQVDEQIDFRNGILKETADIVIKRYNQATQATPAVEEQPGITPLNPEDIPAAHPQLNTEPEVKDPNFQVNNDGTVTRSYSGSYSQIYASKSARGDWAPAGNPDAAQGRSMYALCHVSGNQNACKRLENRCGKDEYVKTESDMYFCLGVDEAETTGQ